MPLGNIRDLRVGFDPYKGMAAVFNYGDGAGNWQLDVIQPTGGVPENSWRSMVVQREKTAFGALNAAVDSSTNRLAISYSDGRTETYDMVSVNLGLQVQTIGDPTTSYSWREIRHVVRKSNGEIHACLLDQVNSDALYHATNATGKWVYTNLTSDSGGACDITLDSSGNPHIAYRTTAGALGYTKRISGVWSSIGFSSGGYHPRIKVDTDGDAHIVHDNGSNVYYGKTKGGNLSVTIQSGAVKPSIILDEAQVPRVAYYDTASTRIGTEYWTGSGWTGYAIVDSGPYSAVQDLAYKFVSIAGIINWHAVAFTANDGLYVTDKYNTGSWSKRKVVSSAQLGSVDLLLNTQSGTSSSVGRMYVAYEDRSDGAMYVSTNEGSLTAQQWQSVFLGNIYGSMGTLSIDSRYLIDGPSYSIQPSIGYTRYTSPAVQQVGVMTDIRERYRAATMERVAPF